MRLQTETQPEPLETLLAKANEQALQQSRAASTPLSAAELARLLADPEELRKFTRKRLIQTLAVCPLTPALVTVAKEIIDRLDGKPLQQVKQEINHSGAVALMTKEEVGDLIAGWIGDDARVIEN